jgi:hypothetical protein
MDIPVAAATRATTRSWIWLMLGLTVLGILFAMELVSTDVVHGLHLEGYDLQVSAEPGQTATLSFTAGRTGTFRFRCSVTCGPLHPFMIGKLKVGNNNLFWRGLAIAALAALVGLWGWRK